VAAVGGERCRRCGGSEQPCCAGSACGTGLLCQFDGRCRTDVCGQAYARCCGASVCAGGTACVSLATAAALDGGVSDAGDADAGDADADDVSDADVSDADVSDADVSDADDVAEAGAPGVCLPCGTQDQPCCASRRCEGSFLGCDPAAPEGAPVCRLCGFAGAPCCVGPGACRDGSRCATRAGDIGRCVDEPTPPGDASADAR